MAVDVEEVSEEIVEKPKRGKKIKNTELGDEVMNSSDNSIQSMFENFMTNTSKIEKGKDSLLKIPTNIQLLDTILGGGFGMRYNLITGLPGTGKSALCASVMSSGQKIYGKNFIGVYCDSEEAMTLQRLSDLGIRNPEIEPTKDMSIEKLFKIIEAICVFKENNPSIMEIPSLVIIDSLSDLHTEVALDMEDHNQAFAMQRAGIFSFYLTKYISKMNKYNICVIGIAQVRDEINVEATKYNKPPKFLKFIKHGKVAALGNSSIYNASQLLEIVAKDLNVTKDGEAEFGFPSINLKINAAKNKFFSPNVPVECVFGFSNGFSNFWTNFNLLVDYGRIKSGSWFQLNSNPTTFRKGKALEMYKTNPEWKLAFDNDVKDVLQKEFIEKYKVEREEEE